MRPLPVLTALLVMVGLYFWVGQPLDANQPSSAEAPAEQPARDPVRVVTYLSEAQPVESAVVLRGRTEAHRLVDLRAETSGLVVSEPRRAGASVEEGDVLCSLDPGPREAQLAEARARLAQARADANAAETLSERGLTAENTAIARRAALEAAAAAVRVAEIEIERLEIAAPFAGVLETDAAERGELLRVGDVCARVVSLEPIKIVGFVSETEVGRLSVGQTAFARLVSGDRAQGEVSFVSRSADVDTRTFRVEITAANPGGAMRDGVTAEIMIPLAGAEAHLVPQAALTLNDAGELGVRTVVDGKAKFRRVEILREEPRGLWLTGLPPEAEIIYVGQEFVSDGRAVAAKREPWSPSE
jgi:multidrug efflux system membrane fusion protein